MSCSFLEAFILGVSGGYKNYINTIRPSNLCLLENDLSVKRILFYQSFKPCFTFIHPTKAVSTMEAGMVSLVQLPTNFKFGC
jgi:hypothetical protein